MGAILCRGKDGSYILDQENKLFGVFWMMISLPRQWEEVHQ